MKIKIATIEKETFLKTCIEARCTCKFHEIEGNPDMLNVYVRDNDLGELTPAIACYLGIAFQCNRNIEANDLRWKENGTYLFQNNFKPDEN